MSAAHEQIRKRRPPKTFLISTDMKVQDHLDGTIVLKRGFICQEQDSGKNRGDSLWVKVLDNDVMLKIERKYLLEVQSDLSGLLEPVCDLEARLKLLSNLENLWLLAGLPVNSPLWVQMGSQDELAEADLKYIGPLTSGGSAVFFGVQLKGSAVGKGTSNGSYKGHRLFSCPEACALFLPVSHIRLRHWSRDHQHQHHRHHRSSSGGNNNPPSNGHQHGRHISSHPHRPGSPPQPQSLGVLSRTAESAPLAAQNQVQVQVRGPASPPRLHVGQRVCFPLETGVYGGEVRFCGLLPGRSSSGTYVGVLLDAPLGNWDGFYNGEKLCNIPNPLYGLLLPDTKVSSELKSHRHNPPLQMSKSIQKPSLPPVTKPGPSSPSASAPRVALMPPGKQALRPPPLPPPKPSLNALPPLPPPKPRSPTSPTTNGAHGPPSLLRSPDSSDDGAAAATEEGEEAGPEGELEVGSMVEVNDPPIFGFIRWIGQIGGISEPVAGIELVR